MVGWLTCLCIGSSEIWRGWCVVLRQAAEYVLLNISSHTCTTTFYRRGIQNSRQISRVCTLSSRGIIHDRRVIIDTSMPGSMYQYKVLGTYLLVPSRRVSSIIYCRFLFHWHPAIYRRGTKYNFCSKRTLPHCFRPQLYNLERERVRESVCVQRSVRVDSSQKEKDNRHAETQIHRHGYTLTQTRTHTHTHARRDRKKG